MNYKIKTVDKSDFDFILSLNQKTLPEVSSTDLVGMSYFLKILLILKLSFIIIILLGSVSD